MFVMFEKFLIIVRICVFLVVKVVLLMMFIDIKLVGLIFDMFVGMILLLL